MEVGVRCLTLPLQQVVGGVNAERAAGKDHEPLVLPVEDLGITERVGAERIVRPVCSNFVDLGPCLSLILAVGQLNALSVAVAGDERDKTAFIC